MNLQELLLTGQLTNPHQILGLKEEGRDKQVIRLWRPDWDKCVLEVKGAKVEAVRTDASGLYEYEVPATIKLTDYRVMHQNGQTAYDPYAFSEIFGELDAYLIGRGLHYELYNVLGSSFRVHQGVEGVYFAVWAPNALGVSLVGDFNHWDGRVNPMRAIRNSGVWEIFVPGLKEGERYKYEIFTRDKERKIKSDPAGHYFEMRPKTASVVYDINRFSWSDANWLNERSCFRRGNVPLNIYEVHPGSWQRQEGNFLNYRELAERLVRYCHQMHYTHVELMGICEHPLDESWGYQVTGYFAPTSRYGTPEDFQYMVNRLHENNLGVILDWVPAHFPVDEHSLALFDGTHLYEHDDPRRGFHPHWATNIFNYGRWEVSNFLLASALFWLEKMHVDGLRVDAVASMLYLDYGRKDGEWVPNEWGGNTNLEALEFLKHLNSIVHKRCPSALMIAEESTAFPDLTKNVDEGGIGFDLKWSMGWMHDTLRFFKHWFSDRGHYLWDLVHIGFYIFFEKSALVLSHDEVVYGKQSLLDKMLGRDVERFAGLRLLLSWMICFPGKKLLFMGGEFGQWAEWNCKEEIHWYLLDQKPHAQLQAMTAALNACYKNNPALYERDFDREGFEWVGTHDQFNSVLAYLRKSRDQTFLCVHHFDPRAVEGYRIPLRRVKSVKEIFNTNREEWGGFAMLPPSPGLVEDQVQVHLPGLATLILEVEFASDGH